MSQRTACHRCEEPSSLFIDLSCFFLIWTASLIHRSILLLSLSMTMDWSQSITWLKVTAWSVMADLLCWTDRQSIWSSTTGTLARSFTTSTVHGFLLDPKAAKSSPYPWKLYSPPKISRKKFGYTGYQLNFDEELAAGKIPAKIRLNS